MVVAPSAPTQGSYDFWLGDDAPCDHQLRRMDSFFDLTSARTLYLYQNGAYTLYTIYASSVVESIAIVVQDRH
jgi:hypothetical protein